MGKTAYATKARDYAAYRMQYARESVHALCETAGLDASWVVADIASGTGNVSRHLVGRVARVYAVEPDDAMRQQAERLLSGCPSFTSIVGMAEATTLPNQSVDLITVGQAFHWFDPERTQREFNRILRTGGWLALIWNRFGTEPEPNYSGFLRKNECTRLSFPVTIRENWEQFIGGARTVANTPDPGDAGYAQFEREQRMIFDARSDNGMITVKFTTELIVGRMIRGTE